ncbi:MAG: type VII toxin-antitoxin system HepT family RNase toxin, partial [Planctomycetota bacterium]
MHSNCDADTIHTPGEGLRTSCRCGETLDYPRNEGYMGINGTIQRKLEFIAENMNRLENLKPTSVSTLEEDFFLKSGIERTLQISIEAMIDVANRILAIEQQPPASNSYESLKRLQQLGYIQDAEVYRDMVRFRNLIVHRYENIGNGILVGILRRKLHLFRDFIGEIEDNV